MVSAVVTAYIVDEEMEKMTYDCIDSFKGVDELVVADDASPFDFKRELRTDVVKYARAPKNLGNAGIWNFGISHTQGDIIILSDNDIVVGNWKEMIPFLEKYDIVFPVVYNERTARDEEMLAGMFFMFKRSLYDKIGPFDETYGSYFEDTDWFKRVIDAGGKLGIGPGHVIHRSQGTFQKIWTEEKRQANFLRNKAIYESKYGPNYPYLS